MGEQRGLDYTIRVNDEFSGVMQDFRDEVSAARASFRGLRNDFRGLRESGQELAALARGARQLAQAGEGARRGSRDVDARTAAERRLAKILQERATEEQLVALAERTGIDLSRAKNRALSDEEIAEQRVIAAQRRRRQAEIEFQLGMRRGVAVQNEYTRELERQARAAERAQRATERLAAQQRAAVARAAADGIRELERQGREEEQARRNAIRADLERRGEPATRARFADRNAAQTAARAEDIRRTAQAQRELADATDRADKRGNSLFFTFRRLIGVFAAFQAIRVGANLFRQLIQGAVEFNSNIEQMRLGIASVITAVGQVRNPQGQIVQGAQALAAAQGEARRQMTLLRRDALGTAATFEQLVQTFQTAIGPGLTAGLNLDQVRQFSVRVSQAASAIGLSQDQLAEEIRSILSGTPSARSTRIANVLNLSPAELQRARSAGTLMDLLNQKFNAFEITGKEALNTFSNVFTNLKSALEQIIGAGAFGFFEELKKLLQDTFKLTVQMKDGVLNPNPELVKVAQAFFDGLKAATEEARRFMRVLDITDLRQIAELLGNTISLLARVVSGLLQGLIRGFSDVAAIINTITRTFSKIAGVKLFNTESLTSALASLTRIAVVIAAIRTSVSAITLALGLLPAKATLIAVAFNPVTIALALVAAALGGIVFLTSRWIKELTGIDAKFETIKDVIVNVVASSFQVALTQVETGWVVLISNVKQLLIGLKSKVIDTFAGVLESTLRLAGKLSDTAQEAAEGFARARATFAKEGEDALKAEVESLAKAKEELAKQEQAARDAFQRKFDDAVKNNENADTFGQALVKGIDAAKSKIQETLKALGFDFGSDIVDKASEAKEEIQQAFQFAAETGFLVEFKKELTTALTEMSNLVTGTVNLIQSAIQQVASAVAGVITSAFTPDDTSIKERFGRMFQALGQMILQFVIQLLIAKAILKSLEIIGNASGTGAGTVISTSGNAMLDSWAASGISAPPGFGGAEGGIVPRRAAASPAHFTRRARGYDTGGVVRPAGLDPRDTVPVWARPNEVMIRPEAGFFYGHDAFAALNAKLVDPIALRALTSSRRAPKLKTGGRGFATGGVVAGGSGGGGGPVPAYIVANDQELDRLLNGGSNAFMRFMEKNRSQINGRLRR